MTILPRPPRQDEDPPAVAVLRERVRRNRAYRWLQRHRSGAAVVAAAVVVARAWRWLVVAAVAGVLDDRGPGDWLLRHWALAAGVTALVFAAAYVLALRGFEWADRRIDPDSQVAPSAGPAWAERPPDRSTTHVPPRMG